MHNLHGKAVACASSPTTYGGLPFNSPRQFLALHQRRHRKAYSNAKRCCFHVAEWRLSYHLAESAPPHVVPERYDGRLHRHIKDNIRRPRPIVRYGDPKGQRCAAGQPFGGTDGVTGADSVRQRQGWRNTTKTSTQQGARLATCLRVCTVQNQMLIRYANVC